MVPAPRTPTPFPQTPSCTSGTIADQTTAAPGRRLDVLQSAVDPVPRTPTPVPQTSAWTVGTTSTRPPPLTRDPTRSGCRSSRTRSRSRGCRRRCHTLRLHGRVHGDQRRARTAGDRRGSDGAGPGAPVPEAGKGAPGATGWREAGAPARRDRNREGHGPDRRSPAGLTTRPGGQRQGCRRVPRRRRSQRSAKVRWFMRSLGHASPGRPTGRESECGIVRARSTPSTPRTGAGIRPTTEISHSRTRVKRCGS